MFTGIVETVGKILLVKSNGTNKSYWVESNISADLKIDQSVSHNGVCLTVETTEGNRHKVTAIAETLAKTNLSHWQEGTLVNLERCLVMNARLDGHLVQGHVDTTAVCTNVINENGSWLYRFSFPENFAPLLIEKGSICLNGTSLTIFNIDQTNFSVAIIPYTYNHTNIKQIQQGSAVNIEFDMVGKYIVRGIELRNNNSFQS